MSEENLSTVVNNNPLFSTWLMGEKTLEDALSNSYYTSQSEALTYMLEGKNIFLSGPAGSGKTHVIKTFIDILHQKNPEKNVVITATTGMAATLINGVTIHSWCGLTPVKQILKQASELPRPVQLEKEKFKYCDVLIIDEISMMPAYFFDNLNFLLQLKKRNKLPFGGVQIICIGDFNQLPPVPNKNVQADQRFCFFSQAWKEMKPVYCYLDKIHRSVDKELNTVLNDISTNNVTESTMHYVTKRINAPVDKEKTYTMLYSLNCDVEKENMKHFRELPGREYTFFTDFRWEKYEYRPYRTEDNKMKILRQEGIPLVVRFKKGAKVILTKNTTVPIKDIHNPREKKTIFLPNGSVGIVVSCDKNAVHVRFNNGKVITIRKIKIDIQKRMPGKKTKDNPNGFKNISVASVTYMPLKLGWAVSVHKSQGSTYDGVITDLRQCFAPGLGYVALSRVRTLRDLIILGVNDTAFRVDKDSLRMSIYVKKKAREQREMFIQEKDSHILFIERMLGL